MKSQWQFWVLAIFVGMFQGGIQALSRSYFAKIIPAERSGEYFGLMDICGKGASFLGIYYLIRSAFGGYHAETSLVCMLVSYGGWGAVMILSRYMEAYAEVPLVLWIVLAADLCVFAILGPVAHANKPLTAVQKKRNKRNGFLVLGIGSLLVFLWRSCVIVGTVYIGTVTFVAVLAMIGKRKVGTRYEED